MPSLRDLGYFLVDLFLVSLVFTGIYLLGWGINNLLHYARIIDQ